MGNCMRKNQISSSQDDGDEEVKRVEEIKKPSSLKSGTTRREENMKKKVRFKTEEVRGHDGNSTSGGVRIRLVVTKEELKRVLSNKNITENDDQHTSLEELLSEMKLNEKSVSKIEESDGSLNSCRSALESIPENRSMK